MKYLIIATLLLSGCAIDRTGRMIAAHSESCEQLGYVSNTDQWRNCIMQMESNRLNSVAAWGALVQTQKSFNKR